LDIEGNKGSSLLGTGSKFSFSTVEESCETNPLFQGTVIQINLRETVPLNRYLILNIHLCDL
jgi:hypothetical protein